MKIEANGLLLIANLHDGWLNGYLFRADRRLEVFLQKKTGECLTLCFGEVDLFRGDEFRQRNILSEIIVLDGSSVSEVMAREYIEGTIQTIPSLAGYSVSNSYGLVEITCSYGCSIRFRFSGTLNLVEGVTV